MWSRTTLLFWLSLIWLLPISEQSHAQDSQPSEYQLKAAFIFNFARFVQWPARAYSTPTSPLVAGILGDNPFHDTLERTVRGKSVDEHPMVVKEFRTLSEVTNCQILFISSSEKAHLPQIIKNLNGASVLTISEMADFTEHGGMINFVMEGTKIRFQINNEAAASVGLKISSKLLALALHPEH